MTRESQDGQDAEKLRRRVLSRWDNEGGATNDGRPERFKVGDRVNWNSEAGRVSGTIVRIHTRDTDYKGHTHHASPAAPQYEIKSSKTDHIALHRGQVLTRMSD